MGKLIQAPKFDAVPGFDRETNGLFEIKISTNQQDLVYVNLDAEDEAEARPDTLETAVAYSDFSLVECWKAKGTFNWKLGGVFWIT